MTYYCDNCNKTIKLKSKYKHFKSFTHNELAKTFQIINSVDNPNFFHVDGIYHKFINVHNKKYFFYFFKCKFNLVFDTNFFPCIETHLHSKSIWISFLKKILINVIEDFINKGYKFSHISNMNIITFNLKRYMT